MTFFHLVKNHETPFIPPVVVRVSDLYPTIPLRFTLDDAFGFFLAKFLFLYFFTFLIEGSEFLQNVKALFEAHAFSNAVPYNLTTLLSILVSPLFFSCDLSFFILENQRKKTSRQRP